VSGVRERDARDDTGVEMIKDRRGMAAGDSDAGEQMAQQPGASLGQFIENERTAGNLGEDGEKAGAGQRLRREIASGDRGRGGGGARKAKGDRGREPQ